MSASSSFSRASCGRTRAGATGLFVERDHVLARAHPRGPPEAFATRGLAPTLTPCRSATEPPVGARPSDDDRPVDRPPRGRDLGERRQQRVFIGSRPRAREDLTDSVAGRLGPIRYSPARADDAGQRPHLARTRVGRPGPRRVSSRHHTFWTAPGRGVPSHFARRRRSLAPRQPPEHLGRGRRAVLGPTARTRADPAT